MRAAFIDMHTYTHNHGFITASVQYTNQRCEMFFFQCDVLAVNTLLPLYCIRLTLCTVSSVYVYHCSITVSVTSMMFWSVRLIFNCTAQPRWVCADSGCFQIQNSCCAAKLGEVPFFFYYFISINTIKKSDTITHRLTMHTKNVCIEVIFIFLIGVI